MTGTMEPHFTYVGIHDFLEGYLLSEGVVPSYYALRCETGDSRSIIIHQCTCQENSSTKA